jgi:RNA polymerase sigma-70 factor, ECF subfamily
MIRDHLDLDREKLVTFLRFEDNGPRDSSVLAFFKSNFGFVPNVFRDQMLRSDIVQAEANLIDSVLLKQGALTRFQKECILLVVSAGNSNTYSVALLGQTLEILGISREESDQIAVDHDGSTLPEADKALLEAIKKLAETPTAFSEEDIKSLRSHGFSEEQILESILITGLANFLNTVQIGLGAVPDFPPRIVFPLKKEVNLSSDSGRQTIERALDKDFLNEDPDTEIVARVQAGDTDAFEELVRKHGRRIYRSLVGILGSADEAEDAMQDVFMKAFQHIGDFERRSRFSTWLVRIAINTAIQRVRGRKEIDSLEEEDGEFRPRNIQAWQDDPEQCCSKEEMRRLIEKEIIKLPVKYRLVLMLRDVEELSTAEAANALGLGVPALKARLVRGRLMLREALVPYFSRESTGVTA